MNERNFANWIQLKNNKARADWAMRYYATVAHPLADLRTGALLTQYRRIEFVRRRICKHARRVIWMRTWRAKQKHAAILRAVDRRPKQAW